MEIAIQRVDEWIQIGDITAPLDLIHLGLTHLPDLPDTLKILYCNYNKLTSLPDNLPRNLEILYCSYNELTILPNNLPRNLEILYCSYNNKLTSLPDLPDTLQILYCSYNQLTSLPDLSRNLEILYCDHNQLINLPELPNTLKELNCNWNELTSLPELPSNLHTLYCEYNPFVKGFGVNKPPIKIPYTVKTTDLKPDQYIIIKPKINIKDVETYLPPDVSYIVDEYLGETCSMLSEYGERCGHKTFYNKQYVDKDGVLIDMNNDEIKTLIKYGINPKIINKKYNCINYCKQHCNFGISKILDIQNKNIIIYSNNKLILNSKINLISKIKNLQGEEEKFQLLDLCKQNTNYHIELYILVELKNIPENYKIKFEEHNIEVKYVSNSRWKLIDKNNKIYAFLEYDLILNE